MLGRRRSLLNIIGQDTFLPSGWRAVPYITTNKDNKEYINTFVTANQTTRIEMDAEGIGYSIFAVYPYFEANQEYGQNRFGILANNDQFRADYISEMKNLGVAHKSGQRYFIVKDGAKNYIDGVELPSNTSTVDDNFSTTRPIHLSATTPEKNTNMYWASMKIYGCKIYNEGKLVRDYVPASNGTIEALYDKVNGEFYYKDGSCDFYHDIEYVFNNIRKKEYWNTGFMFESPGNWNTSIINIKIKLVDYASAGYWNVLGANNYPINEALKITSHSNEFRYVCGDGSKFLKLAKAGSETEFLTCNNNDIYTFEINAGVCTARIEESGDSYAAVYSPSPNMILTKSIFVGAYNGNNGAEGLTGIRIYDRVRLGTYITLHPMSNGAEEVLLRRNQITDEQEYIHKSILA